MLNDEQPLRIFLVQGHTAEVRACITCFGIFPPGSAWSIYLGDILIGVCCPACVTAGSGRIREGLLESRRRYQESIEVLRGVEGADVCIIDRAPSSPTPPIPEVVTAPTIHGTHLH